MKNNQIVNYFGGLEGEFTIEIKDAKTLEVRQTITQENTITDRFINEAYTARHSTYANEYIGYGGIILPWLTSLNISFSTEAPGNGKRSLFWIGNFIGTASTDTINIGPKTNYIDFNNDGIVEEITISQRLGFVGSLYPSNIAFDRFFRTIALTNIASAIDHTAAQANSGTSGAIWAYIDIGSNIQQKKNEIIDVTYRIRLPSSYSGYNNVPAISQDMIYAINRANGFSWNSTFYTSIRNFVFPLLYGNFKEANKSCLNFFVYGDGVRKFSDDSEEVHTQAYGAARYDFVASVPNTKSVGRYYTMIGTGYQAEPSRDRIAGRTVSKLFGSINYQSTSTPFQNMFSHGNSATLPFQDSNNLASGSGKPNIQGSWADNFPELYRIEILNSGSIGTATYVFQRSRVTHFNDNAFNYIELATIFTHQNNLANGKPYPRYHAGTGETTHDIAYSKTQIIRHDSTGISIINLVNGDHQDWDSSTQPSLPVTALRHVEFVLATGKIYAACDNTGLWEITPGNSSAVINLVTTGCRSVSAGFSNILYALFWDGAIFTLRNSQDWNTNLTFTFPLSNLNSSDNRSLWFITADKSAPNRIALFGTQSNNNALVWWWTLSGGIANGYGFGVAGATNTNALSLRQASPKYLVSSPKGQWYSASIPTPPWTHSGILLTFGTTTSEWIVSNDFDSSGLLGDTPILDENGYLLSGKFIKEGKTTLFQHQTEVDSRYNSIWDSVCWLGDGLFFGSKKDKSGDYIYKYGNENRITGITGAGINTSNVFNPFVWETFHWNPGTSSWVSADPTWNGTAWVQATRTGKPTHAATETLIDGLTINFTELGNLGFVSGNWYTQVVCLGVLKDNINNVSIKASTYLRPTELITVSETLTISTAEPYSAIVSKSSAGGSNPDPSFRWLDVEVIPISAQISGYGTPATVRTNDAIVPAINEIVVNGSTGTLICNSADAGKTITIPQYMIVKGDEPRIAPAQATFANVYRPVLLLRHDTGVIVDAGNIVTRWNDQSGYGNDVVAPTGQNPTSDGTALRRGLPTIRFTDNHKRLVLPDSSPIDISRGFTCVAVINRTNGRVFQYILTLGNLAVFGFVYNSLLLANYGANNQQYNLFKEYGKNGTWAVVSATFNPNTGKASLRVDSVNIGSELHPSYTGRGFGNRVNSQGYQCIGGDGVNDRTFIGNMSFLAAYNNYMTTPELKAVEQAALAIA
jgi:hypothetical protein